MNAKNLLALAACAAACVAVAQNADPTDAAPAEQVDLVDIDDSADAAAAPAIKPLKETKPGDLAADTSARVDIACEDATLDDILRQFRQTTGANIITGESTNLQRRVSVNLHDVPWLEGLQSILQSRGFRLEERDGIYRTIEEVQLDPVRTRTYALNHASAPDLAKLFNDSYGVKDNNGKVVRPIATSFSDANVVVVTATDKVQGECEAIIKAVDRAVLQAYIEARFIELDAGAARKLGIKWNSLANGYNVNVGPVKGGMNLTTAKPNNLGLSPTAPASAAVGSVVDLSYQNAFGIAGEMSADAFAATLQAIESMDNATTFSNPKIIVSNGRKARVDMTTKFPNVRVTASRTTQSGSTSMDISAAIESIPGENELLFAKEAFYAWGITLEVTPRISPDGLVTVDIVPTISQLDQSVSADGFYSVESSSGDDTTPYSKYPILDIKRIESVFTMKDGSTAVIGGLSRTVDSVQESGIPWLRDIPWIGPRLFSWKSRVKSQKEIIIFVTVGLANPTNLPSDAGLPKNAVLGREYVEGRKLEPGDKPIAESIRLDFPVDGSSNKTPRSDNKHSEEPPVDFDDEDDTSHTSSIIIKRVTERP